MVEASAGEIRGTEIRVGKILPPDRGGTEFGGDLFRGREGREADGYSDRRRHPLTFRTGTLLAGGFGRLLPHRAAVIHRRGFYRDRFAGTNIAKEMRGKSIVAEQQGERDDEPDKPHILIISQVGWLRAGPMAHLMPRKS
jgi:hypothetical protein